MQDASPKALETLEPLLEELRRRPQLEEKQPGTFYAEARVFVRLGEVGDQLFADLRWRTATSSTGSRSAPRSVGDSCCRPSTAASRNTDLRLSSAA